MWLALLLAVSLARPAAPSDDAAVLLERIAELAAEPSPEAESELVRLLAHDDFEVVSEAAAALRTCADRKGRRALEERVTDGPTPAIRRAALRSLLALDGDDGIDGLLRDLKGSFVPDALEALAQVAQETPELGPQPRLADFTRSRDVQVRTAARQAAVALDRTGDGLTALLEDDDPRVTAAVAGAAARWPQPAHFEACLAALADDALWPPTRRRLARAAAAALRAGGDEVLPSLPRLEGHSALALGSALASGKASSRDVELAGRLTTEGLRAQDPQVRALAARTLGRLGAAGAAERLGNTLVDPVDAVRLAAATAVATTLRGPRATPLLAPRIQTDDDPMVRTACALGLGQRDNLPAIGPLANALGSSDWRTSCAAALAIGRIESEGSVGPLRTYARFRAADRYRAAAATIGLGTTGRREVLAELVDALESQHPLQAACAFSVLRRQATAPADLDEGDLEEWYAWAEERVEATTESALPFDVLAVPSRLFVHGERARATVDWLAAVGREAELARELVPEALAPYETLVLTGELQFDEQGWRDLEWFVVLGGRLVATDSAAAVVARRLGNGALEAGDAGARVRVDPRPVHEDVTVREPAPTTVAVEHLMRVAKPAAVEVLLDCPTLDPRHAVDVFAARQQHGAGEILYFAAPLALPGFRDANAPDERSDRRAWARTELGVEHSRLRALSKGTWTKANRADEALKDDALVQLLETLPR